MSEVLKDLRDAILLQADYLNLFAEQLELFAKDLPARTVMEKRLHVAATECRARAKNLNEVLAATEPRGGSLTMNTCELLCTGGSILAEVGDRFDDESRTWEITRFGHYCYSPSALGGTPGVFCKLVSGELNDWWKRWVEPDGTVEWCGDSVAVMLREQRRAAS